MERIKIREVDKDVYELSCGGMVNSMFASGEQLRALSEDIIEFFEESVAEDNEASLQKEE